MIPELPSASIVIPARLASTRLPRKVLADLDGRPLLWHVWNRARRTAHVISVVVVTDAREVCDAVQSWGGTALLTSPDCPSGTDRIASALDLIPGDLILNVQGDEPMISERLLGELIRAWAETHCDIITPVFPIRSAQELLNPGIVKVARSAAGSALYFSRHPIPYLRDLPVDNWLQAGVHWGHLGIYGFPRSVLARFPQLLPSSLERLEGLEQLRWLEAGYRIHTIVAEHRTPAVDTMQDLQSLRDALARARAAGGTA